MDSNVVFRKTSKGLEEIERRIYRLSPRERLLLIQVDGKRSLAALAGKMGLEREGLDTAGKLLASGFIEIAPGMAIRPMDARPVQAGSSAALLTAARLPPPAPPRPAPAPTATTRPTAPAPQASPAVHSQREAPADLRSERRPANWLTSTVAHLTNLFSGVDENGGGEARPAPTPSRLPPQGRQNTSHHLAALVSSMAHEPVIDLTAAAEPGFSSRPAASARVTPPVAQNPISIQPPPPTRQDALQAQLAAHSAHEPVLDLTESFEELFPRPPAAPLTAVVQPAAAPPVTATPVAVAAVDCPRQAACTGCARCPTNSVSRARNFMKDCLGRFTTNGGNSLAETLDECRTLADLQRQFEPWLRKLLTSGEGVAEAPALAARLQHLLLQ